MDDRPDWGASLSLRPAAEHAGVDHKSLRTAAIAGRVRVLLGRDARGRTTYRFDPAQLTEDLARLRCRYPGCERVALGDSGGCGAHGAVVAEAPRDPRAGAFLSLRRAAEYFDVDPDTLSAAVSDGRVRAILGRDARGRTRYVFDPDRLEEDLEALRCRYEGCDRITMSASGGCRGAHDYVLAAAGTPQALSLGRAAELFHTAPRTLRAAAAAGRVQAARVVARGTTTYVFDRAQLEEDLAGLRCRYEGCDHVALAASGSCRNHAAALHGTRARSPVVAHLHERREQQARELEERMRREQLLDTAGVAARLGLSAGAVCRFVRTGELEATRSDTGNGLKLLYRKDDVTRTVIAIARSDSPQRRRFRTVEFEVAQLTGRGVVEGLLANGLTVSQAKFLVRAMAEENVQRRRCIERHRRGRRAGASPPPTYHREWLTRHAEILAELEAEDDGTPISSYRAARRLVQEDVVEHPERWPEDRYPRGTFGVDSAAERTGAQRVLKAIKALHSV